MEGELGVDGVDLREVDADVALAVDDDVGAVAAAIAEEVLLVIWVIEVDGQIVESACRARFYWDWY